MVIRGKLLHITVVLTEKDNLLNWKMTDRPGRELVYVMTVLQGDKFFRHHGTRK